MQGKTLEKEKLIDIKQFCDELSISYATAKNWIKLNKIYPDTIINKEPMFYPETLRKIKTEIKKGSNKSLKSRRNKTHITGNEIYNSYISKTSPNQKSITNLLNILPSNLTEIQMQLLIAECALQLFSQKENIKTPETNLLWQYLEGNLNISKFSAYIDEFTTDKNYSKKFIENNQNLFNIRYTYKPEEDTIGFLYISLKNLGNRKACGMYYTSSEIIKKLLLNLFKDKNLENKKILDPCCGSGNFLLRLPENIMYENIYASDIDVLAVKIAGINLALKFGRYDINFSKKHITQSNYLTLSNQTKYDYILGNPPWGYNFTEEEKACLKKSYKTAECKNIESFDLFVEKAFKTLKENGYFSYILPEAILNVKTHEPVRKIIINEGKIEYLEFLKQVFDKVQCPSIILKVKKTPKRFSYKNTQVSDGRKVRTIKKERKIDSQYFYFKTTDEEEKIIEKIYGLKNIITLENNADFALGIVTGNNKNYISNTLSDTTEPILKGTDIDKYTIKKAKTFIHFTPKNFQQTAPEKFYRAKEKLLYRFISNKLIFAYDNKQTLSLNSCNILIPKIKDLNIKYILAVLNSKIADFIYKKKFNSVKVLRSHIEQIPIVKADRKAQERIIKLVDEIINEKSFEKAEQICEKIENQLCEIYHITAEERKIINSIYAVSTD